MPSLADLKRRLALAPGDAALRQQVAEALFGEGDYAAAAAVLEKASQLDPNGRRLLVASHLRRGAREAARAALERAARERPADAEVRDELAELLLEDGRADDALLFLDEADSLAFDPRRALRRARLLRQRRLLRPALKILSEAARVAPLEPALAAELREVEAELGQDAVSAALIDPAVASAGGRVAEAREHLRAGDLERARRALAMADPAEAGFRALRSALQAARRGRGAADRQPEETRVGLIGVLGWSPKGGSVSPLQAVAVPGAGALHITGNVGASGQEAARVAWTCLKARAAELGVAREVVQQDLHLHYADTEIAKDGASSGLALVLAGLSALRRAPLPADLAATGEIALTGEVRPVAGIHEKLVAAALAGVETALLPRRNLRDARELPARVPARVRLVFVDTLSEAAAAVLGGRGS